MTVFWHRSTRNILWIDAKIGRWWYVLIWRNWKTAPFCYRSLDATPPSDRPKCVLNGKPNQGRMVFGRYSD